MGTVPNSHAQHEERYVADGASTPDDGSSPEGIITCLLKVRQE